MEEKGDEREEDATAATPAAGEQPAERDDGRRADAEREQEEQDDPAQWHSLVWHDTRQFTNHRHSGVADRPFPISSPPTAPRPTVTFALTIASPPPALPPATTNDGTVVRRAND